MKALTFLSIATTTGMLASALPQDKTFHIRPRSSSPSPSPSPLPTCDADLSLCHIEFAAEFLTVCPPSYSRRQANTPGYPSGSYCRRPCTAEEREECRDSDSHHYHSSNDSNDSSNDDDDDDDDEKDSDSNDNQRKQHSSSSSSSFSPCLSAKHSCATTQDRSSCRSALLTCPSLDGVSMPQGQCQNGLVEEYSMGGEENDRRKGKGWRCKECVSYRGDRCYLDAGRYNAARAKEKKQQESWTGLLCLLPFADGEGCWL